jgi:hypothetical protein
MGARVDRYVRLLGPRPIIGHLSSVDRRTHSTGPPVLTRIVPCAAWGMVSPHRLSEQVWRRLTVGMRSRRISGDSPASSPSGAIYWNWREQRILAENSRRPWPLSTEVHDGFKIDHAPSRSRRALAPGGYDRTGLPCGQHHDAAISLVAV